MTDQEQQVTGESHDGDRAGAGDHDTPYVFGNPRAALTLLCQARLTILRGYLLDASHATTVVPYGGDRDETWAIEVRPSGLAVPLVSWPDNVPWPDEA